MCICFVVFFFGVWFVLFVSIVTSFTRWRCVCYFSYLYFIVSIFFFLFIRSNIITLIYLYLVCIHAVAAHRTSVQMPMDTVHTQATHTNTHAHELLAVVLLYIHTQECDDETDVDVVVMAILFNIYSIKLFRQTNCVYQWVFISAETVNSIRIIIKKYNCI